MLKDIQIHILYLFLIQVMLYDIQYLLVLEDLLVAVEDFDVFTENQLVGDLELFEVVLNLLPH